MFSFNFTATPDDRHPNKDKILATTVLCCVDRSSIEEAVEVARQKIREELFVPGEPKGIRVASQGDFEEGTTGRDLFERAAASGQAFEIVSFAPDLSQSTEDS